MLLRALLAFIALPGLIAFAAPLLIARPRVREGSFNALALVLLIPGVALLLWCVRDFLVIGKGTLAPWDPPRSLVSSGPYRFSRNPMYVGVCLILLGWAMAFRSSGLLLYALIVMLAFHLRVVFGEEPWLARTHERKWNEYRARVPRWIFPSRRAMVFSWLGAVVLLALAGLMYEAYSDAGAAREFPPPGTMVDIGGRRLHLVCIGREDPMEPMVMFLASGWGNAVSASRARERLATRTRVCSYDRLGHGWSDAAPAVTTIGDTARELGVLQDRAQLVAPFVLVASSIGGLTAEMFARVYPERVAGIVFVDAANSLIVPRMAEWSGRITAAACTGRHTEPIRRGPSARSVRARRSIRGRASIGRNHVRRKDMDGHLLNGSWSPRHEERVRAGARARDRSAGDGVVRIECPSVHADVRRAILRSQRRESRARRGASGDREAPQWDMEENPEQLASHRRQSA